MKVLPNVPLKHSLGHVTETLDVTVFFGDWRSTKQSLGSSFPEYHFSFLKQTHSNKVVIQTAESSGDNEPEGDAQVSSARKNALCIRTADCLPVMIFLPHAKLIAGIHAGWRGVENGIIHETCLQLKTLGGSLDNAYAWIGPHIGPNCFEVGLDVASRLANCFEAVRGFSSRSSVLIEHAEPEKKYVDLLAIACAQLHSHGIENDRTTLLAIDTFTSKDHASFRRDALLAGRQVSFIALK